VCSKKAGYFENVLAIISYTDTEVVLKLKKGSLNVLGSNLFIKSYNKGDICIGGEIISVTFVI
jgi:sporulation protein YqfC